MGHKSNGEINNNKSTRELDVDKSNNRRHVCIEEGRMTFDKHGQI